MRKQITTFIGYKMNGEAVEPLGRVAKMAGCSPANLKALVDAGTVTATRHPLGGWFFTAVQMGSAFAALQSAGMADRPHLV